MSGGTPELFQQNKLTKANAGKLSFLFQIDLFSIFNDLVGKRRHIAINNTSSTLMTI